MIENENGGGPREDAATIAKRLAGKDRKLTAALARVSELETALAQQATSGNETTDELQARITDYEAKLAEYQEAHEVESMVAAMPDGAEAIARRLGRPLTLADRNAVEVAQALIDEAPSLNLADRPARRLQPADTTPSPSWDRSRLIDQLSVDLAALDR